MKKLAIIILTKNKLDLMYKLLNSIVFNTKYDMGHMIVYVADTGSTKKNKALLKNHLEYLNNEFGLMSKLIEYKYYNFASVNNDVVKNHVDSDTELILLCNNDVELINDAITEVVNEYMIRNGIVGTVGARLLYDDLKVQHVGIGMKEGLPFHLFRKSYFPDTLKGKVGKVWGNTGAFLLTSYDLWNKIGGLNEKYVDCFEDVEYNLRCMELGFPNYCAFNAICYHKESQTRKGTVSKDDIKTLLEFYKSIAAKKEQKEDETTDKKEETGKEESTDKGKKKSGAKKIKKSPKKKTGTS